MGSTAPPQISRDNDADADGTKYHGNRIRQQEAVTVQVDTDQWRRQRGDDSEAPHGTQQVVSTATVTELIDEHADGANDQEEKAATVNAEVDGVEHDTLPSCVWYCFETYEVLY